MSPIPVPSNSVLPPGSLILVTGITSFVGGHVADQLLKRGFRVRGVVRDLSKAEWLEDRFEKDYGKGTYEVAHVPDLSVKGALDESMKDVSGVVHLATTLLFGPSTPDEFILPTVAFAMNALESADRSPSVARFVFCSSTASAAMVPPNTHITVTKGMFNETAIEASRRPPPYDPSHAMVSYSASKALAEKAIFQYIAEHPDSRLTVNIVLPEFNSGVPLSVEHQGYPTSAGNLKAVFEGDYTTAKFFPPLHYIHVVDDALLHIAALLHPGAKSERIFSAHQSKNMNTTLALFRRLYPERRFMEDDPTEGENLAVYAEKPRATELLRWMGKDEWTGMEESFKELADSLILVESV
ncbi:hypothetical protein LTR85_001359 [Meristemomyces frigidus]|nr:hypothetical protein LTR85_001359 [Meristemomyces frigidus]